ncbi:MAG: VOC family protein [Vicinamibacterales bacterium]
MTSGVSAVLFVKDVPRMARFYGDVMGLAIVEADGATATLRAGEFHLVLHAIPPAIADTIVLTSPPELRADVPVKLAFPVASLVRARGAAAALGGGLSPEHTEWRSAGGRICDGFDPEGNVVQFREARGELDRSAT